MAFSNCRDDVITQARQARKEGRPLDLSGVDLSGLDLSRAYLRGSRLCGANLTGVDLTGAELSHADLGEAVLAGAKLSRATLSRARLWSADLSDADLSHASLNEARVKKANFTGANLTRVWFAGSSVVAGQLYDCRGLDPKRGNHELPAGVWDELLSSDTPGRLRVAQLLGKWEGTVRQAVAQVT